MSDVGDTFSLAGDDERHDKEGEELDCRYHGRRGGH